MAINFLGSVSNLAARGRFLSLCATLLAVFAPPSGAKDTWLQVETPEFTLVTSLPEKEAVAWAGDFSQYTTQLRTLFKAKGNLPPLTFVIFDREKDFADYRPLNSDGKPKDVAGFFQRHHSWAVAGLAGRTASDEVQRTIFHEGVHWFLSAFDHSNPVWVEEGLAEVFSTFTVTKKRVEWGHAIAEHVALLRGEAMLPMDRLLYVGQSGLFNDSSHTGMVYAQSWITVHFLVFGENNQIPRTALFDFLRLTHEGMAIEPAFRQAVGSDIATFDRRLKEYLRSGSYFVRTNPPVVRAPFTARPAPPVEVAQALGRLALAARRWEKAASFAKEAIAGAPEDPRGYELLGLARSEGGDEAAGLVAFAQAEEKGSRDFQTFFALAAGAQNAAAGGNLPPAEARLMADRYEKAILLAPRFLPSYQNLAGVLGSVEVKAHDREFMELGRRLHPRDGWIRLGLAVLDEHAGQRALALKTVNEIEADAEMSGRVRAQARNLSDQWTQQEVLGRIEALVSAQNYQEALAYVEEQLVAPLPAALRNRLSGMRQNLKASARSRAIGAALSEQHWDEARRLLEDTLASNEMPAPLKQQARRTLDDLNRRGQTRRPTKQ